MERVTQRMVAEAAGVSVAAVSMALRGSAQLPEATRRRIRAVAEEMGYRVNPVLAAGMAQVRHRKAATVGAVLCLLHTQPLEEIRRWAGTQAIVDGAMARAAALGYRLELVQLRVEDRRRLLKRIRDLGIPGGVVIGPRWPELDAVLEELAERVPLVRASGSRRGVRLNFTQVDFFRGVRLALDEVKTAGAERPGLVVPSAFDQAAGRSLSGGFLVGQMDWPKQNRVEPLLDWDGANFTGRLQTWWRHWKPDVILN